MKNLSNLAVLSTNDIGLKQRALWLIAGLALVNLLVWSLTFIAFSGHPAMLAMSFLAWSFGLRHAVDADHIAAIDSTTRKMMQQGKKPLAIGTFFSLGHSTVVILATVAIAVTVGMFKSHLPELSNIGGVIGTSVSIIFLLVMAYINLTIFISVYKTFNRVKCGEQITATEIDQHVVVSGPLFKLFNFAFKLINKSWHMYFIGFLFGLGFDTATEIGLLAMAGSNASHGMNIWLIMLFPALFTAAMSLVDTLNNYVMVGAYGWAFSHPARKLYYNMTITGISVVIALMIGGLESLSALSSAFHHSGGIWDLINMISDKWSDVGFIVIAIFILCWAFSIINYKLRGYDKLANNAIG